MASRLDGPEDVTTNSERSISTAEPEKSTNTSSVPTCVICLDRIVEHAAALPCNHDQFDFPCLGTWLQHQRVCPLCKSPVLAVRYSGSSTQPGSGIFHLPEESTPPSRTGQDVNQRRARAQARVRQHRPYNRSLGDGRAYSRTTESSSKERALNVRREVYRNRTPCLYVGTNRISRYRNITPTSFQTLPHLVARAKQFVRRELAVFDFLNPSSSLSSTPDRRAGNAEFLLEYIVSILRSIDLKGSAGQAEELLKDFLGRENARLFLHELEAWLRSPYERLENWDRHVQYQRTPDTTGYGLTEGQID